MITLRLRKLLNLDKVFGENLNMIKTMCFEEAVECLMIDYFIIYDLNGLNYIVRFNTTTFYKHKHFYLPPLMGHLLDDINDDVVINSSDIQHHWLQYSNEPNSKATLLLKR